MRAGQTMAVFASGCAVYVIMAACSSMGGSGGTSTSGGGGQAMTGGGMATNSSGQAMGGGGMGSGGNAMSSGGMSNGGNGGGSGRDSGIFDVLTDPIPDADAQPMSGSRLKARFRLGADGSKEYKSYGTASPPWGLRQLWYDSMRQEDCAVENAADNKLRCLPVDVTSANFWYLDPQCTQLILELDQPGVQPGCPNPPPKYAVKINPGSVCATGEKGNQKSLYPLGQLIAKPPLKYALENGQCNGYGIAQNKPWYEMGAEVPATDFVEMTDGVDP